MADVAKFYLHQKSPKILDEYKKNPVKRYLYKKTKNLTIKFLELKGNELILDVGCGEGFLISKIKSKYPKTKVIGIDIMKDCLVRSIKKNDEISLVLGDAIKLPFANNTFDKVICTAVLEHLLNPLSAIKEIYRITEIGGTVVLDIPGIFHFQNYLEDFLAERIFKCVPFHRKYTYSKIKQWIKCSGFKITEMYAARFLGSFLCPIAPKIYIPGIGGYQWCNERCAKKLIKIDKMLEHLFGQNRLFKLFGGSWLFQCKKTQNRVGNG